MAIEKALRAREGQPSPAFTWLAEWTHAFQETPISGIRRYFLPPEEVVSQDNGEFPAVPCPNTIDFFKVYGEPLDEFAHWCSVFASAVSIISQRTTPEDAETLANLELRDKYQLLGAIAQGASPSFEVDIASNSVTEVRRSAGLIASFALMFLWDRVEGRRALNCLNCEKYFVSDEPRAKYCSPRCRNTAQSRRFRQKQDAPKE